MNQKSILPSLLILSASLQTHETPTGKIIDDFLFDRFASGD